MNYMAWEKNYSPKEYFNRLVSDIKETFPRTTEFFLEGVTTMFLVGAFGLAYILLNAGEQFGSIDKRHPFS